MSSPWACTKSARYKRASDEHVGNAGAVAGGLAIQNFGKNQRHIMVRLLSTSVEKSNLTMNSFNWCPLHHIHRELKC